MTEKERETLPHWDLSSIYPGLKSEAFTQAVDQLKTELDDLDQYLDDHHIARSGLVPEDAADQAAIIGGYLDRMNSIQRRDKTLTRYVYGLVAVDSYDTAAKRTMSELEALGTRIARQRVRFRGWMGALTEGKPDALSPVLAEGGIVQEHAFYLRETAEQSRYLMSEPEETLAAELSLSGAKAWRRLQGTITSQVLVPFEREGQVEKLPITVIQNLRNHPDEAVRRRAYEAALEAWKRVQEPLAACLNGVKGSVITLYRRRGRTDYLHEPLDQSRIDRGTLEALLGAMRSSFPIFRRYMRAKARRLGKEQLAWWDLTAPVGRAEQRYTFAEARDFILAQFEGFSDRLVTFTRRAFEENWIDAEPRDGKRGGAFCLSLLSVEESRILCNFDGSLDQLTTIAHELGHAYHNECRKGKTPLQRRTPMTLAETASIFNQTIITDGILAQAQEEEEQLMVLESFLADAMGTIVDIYSRYLFEKEVFERREEAELSADDFCEIMVRSQQETYGDGVDVRYLHPYMWTWKPHYYIPTLSFYNFPYAFGLLFSLGLYQIYQERGEAFIAEYDDLLRSTGEATPADLADRFGIDIRQPAFWEAGIQLVQERVERYLAL